MASKINKLKTSMSAGKYGSTSMYLVLFGCDCAISQKELLVFGLGIGLVQMRQDVQI